MITISAFFRQVFFQGNIRRAYTYPGNLAHPVLFTPVEYLYANGNDPVAFPFTNLRNLINTRINMV